MPLQHKPDLELAAARPLTGSWAHGYCLRLISFASSTAACTRTSPFSSAGVVVVSALDRDKACRPAGGSDRPSAFPRGNDGVLCAVHDSDRHGGLRNVLGYRETVLQRRT